MNFGSLDEFWVFYLSQHSKRSTRRWHFAGTLCALLLSLTSILLRRLWPLAAAPAVGYGMAWYSHFFVERNRPATFGHPIWSLICDCKMFGLMMSGKMDREIKRIGKRPISSW